MERVKRDFIDNDTTFLNVLNRGNYSSGQAMANAYRDDRNEPLSAPHPSRKNKHSQR
jgi:hypothetical protein